MENKIDKTANALSTVSGKIRVPDKIKIDNVFYFKNINFLKWRLNFLQKLCACHVKSSQTLLSTSRTSDRIRYQITVINQ